MTIPFPWADRLKEPEQDSGGVNPDDSAKKKSKKQRLKGLEKEAGKLLDNFLRP